MDETVAATADLGAPPIQKPPHPPRLLVPLTFVTPKEQKTESRVQMENPSGSERDESTNTSEEKNPQVGESRCRTCKCTAGRKCSFLVS